MKSVLCIITNDDAAEQLVKVNLLGYEKKKIDVTSLEQEQKQDI